MEFVSDDEALNPIILGLGDRAWGRRIRGCRRGMMRGAAGAGPAASTAEF